MNERENKALRKKRIEVNQYENQIKKLEDDLHMVSEQLTRQK
jgi:hypothetical protein